MIPIKNIYYMLSYAFRVLKHNNYKSIDSEDFEHIEDLYAAILSLAIASQIKQGLYREYVAYTEPIKVIKGKLDIIGTIQQRIQHKINITCEYDELSENNIYNKIIKTTALYLIRKATKHDPKEHLKKLMQYFTSIDTINPYSIKWDTLTFKRNNQTYEMMMFICSSVMKHLLLSNTEGNSHMDTFLDDQKMSRLYEKFILGYYQYEFPSYHAESRQIKWNFDSDSESQNIESFPQMLCDVMLKRNSKTLIIDAKYYTQTMLEHLEKKTLISANLYQIYAYVKNYAATQNSETVSGMLLYAKTDEETIPKAEVSIGGNRFIIRTLDMNQNFTMIKKQLDEIGEKWL